MSEEKEDHSRPIVYSHDALIFRELVTTAKRKNSDGDTMAEIECSLANMTTPCVGINGQWVIFPWEWLIAQADALTKAGDRS